MICDDYIKSASDLRDVYEEIIRSAFAVVPDCTKEDIDYIILLCDEKLSQFSERMFRGMLDRGILMDASNPTTRTTNRAILLAVVCNDLNVLLLKKTASKAPDVEKIQRLRDIAYERNFGTRDW